MGNHMICALARGTARGQLEVSGGATSTGIGLVLNANFSLGFSL